MISTLTKISKYKGFKHKKSFLNKITNSTSSILSNQRRF